MRAEGHNRTDTTPDEAARATRQPSQTDPIAALLHARDWAQTPLGPRDGWPQSLRTAIDICLAWPEPASILWGAQLIQIYNEPYARAPRVRHPAMFGGPLLENWSADRDILSRALTTIRADGQPLVSTDHAVTVDGAAGPEVRTFTFTFAPIRDESGAIGGLLHTAVETTERTRAELALRESEALFRQFGAASSDLLWIREATTLAFAYRSPSFATHYGIDPARMPDDADLDAWAALVHPADRARVLANLGRVRRGERVVNEFRIVRPDTGEERWLRDACFPLHDEAGRVQRIGGIARDITERRRIVAERERLLATERAARAQAEEAVRARDTFLSIAAHELRTPLTALKGTTQLLRRRHDRGALGTERLAAGLTTLDQSADRLTALTADLLDVARIRTGQLPLDPRPLDLAALVAGAVAVARDRAGDEHRLRLEAAADLAPVRADSGRIEQVLTNLLDNAIKYSPEGGTVGVTVRAEGAGVVVAVRDRGIGLPPGAAEAIFTPFGRAANAASSSLPGMGLGLFICRSIVARHGGWIRAASDGEGRGTVMTLWLPTAGPSDTTATDAAAF